MNKHLYWPMLALLPGMAKAMVLGDIEVLSALNHPFAANIPVIEGTPAEVASARFQLASAALYETHGLSRVDYLDTLRFNIVTNREGRTVLEIRSDKPLPEPVLTFLMDIRWSSGRLVHEFNAFLEPLGSTAPVVAAAARPPAPAPAPVAPPAPAPEPAPAPAPVVVAAPEPAPAPAPVVVAAVEPPPPAPAPAPVAPPAPAPEPAPAPAPVVVAAVEPAPAPAPVVVAAVEPAPAPAPVRAPAPAARSGLREVAYTDAHVRARAAEAPPRPPGYTGILQVNLPGETYLLSGSPSLARIGRRTVGVTEETLSRWMLATYRANPDAFSGDVNRLRTGQTLRLPTDAEWQVVTLEEADREIYGREPAKPAPAAEAVTERVADAPVAAEVTERVAEAPVAKAPVAVARSVPDAGARKLPVVAGNDTQAAALAATAPPRPRGYKGPLQVNVPGETYRVQDSPSLERIARRTIGVYGRDLSRFMVATYRANPEAFAGSMNELRSNTTLRLASEAEWQAIAQDEADQELAQSRALASP